MEGGEKLRVVVNRKIGIQVFFIESEQKQGILILRKDDEYCYGNRQIELIEVCNACI